MQRHVNNPETLQDEIVPSSGGLSGHAPWATRKQIDLAEKDER